MGKERLNSPAQETSEGGIDLTQEKKFYFHVHLNYLEFFQDRLGRLVTPEEVVEFHQSLPMTTSASSTAVRSSISRLRQVLKGQKLYSIGSKSEGKYGYYLVPQGVGVTKLSQIGASPFKDEDRPELRVIPHLSLLSRSDLKQNPWLKEEFDEVVAFFDDLGEPNEKTHVQSPRLALTQRIILASLVKHPEGATIQELLEALEWGFSEKGFEVQYDLQRDWRLLVQSSNMAVCRRAIGGRFQIYLLLIGDKQEERRYILMRRQAVGTQIRFETVKTEQFAEPIRDLVEDFCNRFTVVRSGKSESGLKSRLSSTECRLFLSLASRYQRPCTKDFLLPRAYPDLQPASPEERAESGKDLNGIKRKLQQKLKRSGFKIFSVRGLAPKTTYILSAENWIKDGEEREIEIIDSGDLAEIDKEIRQSVQTICNRVRRISSALHPKIGSKRRRVFLEIAKDYPYGCSIDEIGRRLYPSVSNPRALVKYLVSKLRKVLGEEFNEDEVGGLMVFGISRQFRNEQGIFYRDISYILLPKQFSKKKRGEAPLVYPGELIDVNKEIKRTIRGMLNRVKVKGFSLYPVLGGKEREILIVLGEAYPEGLSYQSLINLFFSDCQLPLKALQNQIRIMRRKMSEEFGKEISIRLAERGYVLELREGE